MSKGWHLVIDQIYVTHLLHYVWLGDGKWGREKRGEKSFLDCFVERGMGGWILVGLRCFIPRPTKNKSPKLGGKKGERGVLV